MIRTTPRRLGALVAAVVLAVTVLLAWLAAEVDEGARQALLERDVEQAGTVLTSAVGLVETQLQGAAQVAVTAGADPEAFVRFAEARLPTTSFASMSLWRTGDGPELVAVAGEEPLLPPRGEAALAGLSPNELAVFGVLPGEPARLGYAVAAAGDPGLVVYAEQFLAPERRTDVDEDNPFSGLDLAIYLGAETDPEQLLVATAPVPIQGDTASSTVPFGNTELTLVASTSRQLTGTLPAALPWIVLGAGGALALASGAGVATLSRRRLVAERLAAENERLFHQQRGIAGTLQHALLPDLPRLDGIEVDARYVAGVEELDVGGDWYDVIPRGPGCCVFVIGDISGRGLPAATTMAALRFAVRAYLAQGDDIGTVMGRLRPLLDVGADHQFATVLMGEVDAARRRLRVACAGHFPPLLVTGGAARPVDCPVSPPIGLPDPTPPAVVEVGLPAAGTLLAFTDGLVERRGEVVDTGVDRLAAAAVAREGQELAPLLDELMAALTPAGAQDDTVLVGLRWGG
jgi:hypothetical protein